MTTTTAKMTSARVKRELEDGGFYCDHVRTVTKGEHAGCFKVMSSFFYRHGRSAQGQADGVRHALDQAASRRHELANLFSVVGQEECWQAWPKTSYFVVYVKPTTC